MLTRAGVKCGGSDPRALWAALPQPVRKNAKPRLQRRVLIKTVRPLCFQHEEKTARISLWLDPGSSVYWCLQF